MTRITVADTVLKAGEPWAHTPVRIELCDSTGTPVAPAYVTATGVIVEPFTTATDADGIFTVQLDPTDAIAPTGCFYGVTIGDVGPIVIRGDQGDGSLRSLRASTPTVLGSTATLSGLSDVDLTGRVDGSVLEWDTATSKWVMGTGGGGGGADHGALTGLGDDDHLQYLTEGRGDARYDALGAATAAVSAHALAADPHPGYLTPVEGAAAFDALGAATAAVSGHVGAVDPHGDRAWASGQFQPVDADLTAIAALSTTAFGRALLELANDASGRTALGLGTAATQASSAFDAAGAAAAAQAYAIARANHTGTQTASTISDFDTQVATTAVLKSLVDAKGDQIVGTADNTVARVAVGSDGKVSKADSTQSAGVAWDYAVPPHGSTKNGSTTYYSTPGFLTVNATTSALVANYCFYFPYWVATPITVDQLAIEQTTAGAAGKLMRFGLIAATKNWQPTGSALADSGNIAADGANGVKTYTPGSPVTLPAGRYLGVIHSDGAPTLRAWAGAGLGDSHPTTLGANVNCFWRVSKALGAIDATAWDTVSTVASMYTQIVLRVSEPTA